MGFLDRLRGGSPTPDDDEVVGDDTGADALEPVEEIGIRRPSPEEEASLEAARARYGELGVDPADLGSIAAAFDRAVDEHGEGEAAWVVEVLGTAVGDHLTTVGYRWVVSSDPFGTDLAVEPPRRGVPVVTRMLVAVRWMAREKGWVEGVVGHLARAGRQ